MCPQANLIGAHWEPALLPQEEQYILLTTELSLQRHHLRLILNNPVCLLLSLSLLGLCGKAHHSLFHQVQQSRTFS